MSRALAQLIEDSSFRRLRIHVQQNWTLGDIGRGMANDGEVEGEGEIDLETEIRVISIIDDDTQTLSVIFQDLLQPAATVWCWRFCSSPNIWQTCGKPY